jgi:hypothetical protein
VNDAYDHVVSIYLDYGDPLFYVVSKKNCDYFVDQAYHRNNILIR